MENKEKTIDLKKVVLMKHKLTPAQVKRVKEIDALVRPYRELMMFFLNYICEEAKLPQPADGCQFSVSSDFEHLEGPIYEDSMKK